MTVMPVLAVNCGRMFANSPEASTEVVEANTMDCSAAELAFVAATIATSAKTSRNLIILRRFLLFAPVPPRRRPSH